MTRYICSKMFTDVNIRVPYNSIKNCCKTEDYEISNTEIDDLIASGKNILTDNAEYKRRKESMVIKNVLPLNGCNTCILAEPHSLFRSWNVWNDKTRPSDSDLLANDHFATYEFVISSACDLKCVYCGAKDSSAWAKELDVPVNKGNEEWKQKVFDQLFFAS